MKLSILLIEDCEDDAALILLALKKNGFEPDLKRVDTPEAMQRALQEQQWDIVLSDYIMPRFSGLEALELLQKECINTPFIVISGKIGEETAVEAMRLGASDYILKDRLARLPAAIERAMNYAAIVRREQLTQAWMCKLTSAIEQAGEAILITDKHGVIEYVNAAFSRVTGYDREESLGRNPRFLNSGSQSDSFYQNMWDTILGGDIWQGRIIDRKKDGSLYPVRLIISPIRDENGNITGFAGVHSDMTEHEKLEEQFHQAQKMETIGTMVSGIAHDFNNLLAAISGNLYLARQQTQLLPKVDSRLERVDMLTSRAVDMIAQLMSFSRKQPSVVKTLDITAFIREAFNLHNIIVPENISVVGQFSDDALAVMGDATQLQQILMNLMGNACDALEHSTNGHIDIRLEKFIADDAFLLKHPGLSTHRFARLSVADNGPGIPEQHLKHIFEPFFTSKEEGKGTGLGLAMVLGAVQSHGGLAEVASTAGEGTQFHIYLPLIEEEYTDAEHSEHANDETMTGHGELILLADDETQVRQTGRDVLESLGYRVLEACDGLETVALFTSHQDDIALLLLDVVMPGQSGVAAAEQIRAMRADVPVIFASGYALDHELRHSINLQHSLLLHKPYSVNELSISIHQLIGG